MIRKPKSRKERKSKKKKKESEEDGETRQKAAANSYSTLSFFSSVFRRPTTHFYQSGEAGQRVASADVVGVGVLLLQQPLHVLPSPRQKHVRFVSFFFLFIFCCRNDRKEKKRQTKEKKKRTETETKQRKKETKPKTKTKQKNIQ